MADSSSKIIKALFSSNKSGRNKTNFDIGKINPKILKILGIQNAFEIEDEQEYLSLLKEMMLLISMGKSKLSRENEQLIIDEFKRIKSKKFPKKKITADSFKRGTAVGINVGMKKKRGGISPNQLIISPSIDKMSGKSDIRQIIDALSSIIEQLTMFNKLSSEEQERGRKERENIKRRRREGELEKGFDGVMKAAENIIAPVKSILDRIINFLVMTLLGRSFVLLLRWFSNKDNQDKVKAIGRFLGDHWPKLLALFISFGTGLGRFVRGLIGVVIKGTGALIKGAVALAARAGIKGAGGALKFLGGPKGRLIGAGLELGAVALGTVALSKGLENFGGIGQTPTAKFSGGGFANFRNLFGNIGGFFNGMVSGPKGTDKVPAMLTDGEFVMSRGAVAKYGVDTLESMNAAGGGNNRPKVVEGTTFASGGGMIGNKPKPSELKKEAKFNNPNFVFGKTPRMSSQKDMNHISNKIQVNLASSKGKDINISGATSGTKHSTKYQRRNSIFSGSGIKGIGDKKLSPIQIMMGQEGKPHIGFFAFEKGQSEYGKDANPLGAFGRWLNPNAHTGNDKKMQERKKRESEVNSLEYYNSIGMKDRSIKSQMNLSGQNYTRASTDLQNRQNIQAKIAPTKPISKNSGITPPSKHKVIIKSTSTGGRVGSKRGSGSSPSTATPKVPQFNSVTSTRSRTRTASTYGIG